MRQAGLVALFVLQGALAAPEDVLRLYLARHGQTDWNAAGRMQGGADIPLNETGLGQARRLAEVLAGIPLDAIYSSALQRSRQTAEALRGRAPITALADLNEQSVGGFEGVTREGKDEARRKEFDRRRMDPNDTLDGGESTVQHRARVKAALLAIQSAHPRGNVLVVGHGGTNVKILEILLGLLPEAAAAIRQENDEVYLVQIVPGRSPTVWKMIPPDRLNEL